MSFFSLLPPEINSGMIYSGPGSSSLVQAAAAWQGFAEDLTSTATSITSTISGLGSSFQGPSAAAMTGAIEPFAAFLHTTAAQAAALGAQTTAQAGLYETARGAVASPAAIAANRAEFLVLVATNWLGQNSAAIAANEAVYMGYWTQDAAAMEAYLSATQANTEATTQTAAPMAATNTQSAPTLAGVDPQSLLNGLANVLNHILPAGNQIASGSGIQQIGTGIFNGLTGLVGGSSGGLGGLGGTSALQSIYYPLMIGSIPARVLPSILMQLARMGSMGGMGSAALAGQTAGGAAGPTQLMTQIGEFVDGKLHDAVGVLAGHFTTATNGISAKLAEAASMGQMRVPQGWSAAADGMVRAAPVLPHTTVSAPVQTMSATGGMPGGPFGNAMLGAMAGRGLGSVAAKAPKIVPRSPAGG